MKIAPQHLLHVKRVFFPSHCCKVLLIRSHFVHNTVEFDVLQNNDLLLYTKLN